MTITPLTYTTPPTETEQKQQDDQIRETVTRERSRLSAFIRRRMPDPDTAEDVLQDVFYELTEAYRLAKPIERVVASWLFAVARNKISDWYRRPKAVSLHASSAGDADEEEAPLLTDFLVSTDDSPDGNFFRETFMDSLSDALDELPAEQRDVFVRHEIDGQSFKEMSAELGVSVNTLLSRKRYAVLHLRERLQDLYDELED